MPGRNEKNWMPRGHSFLYDVVTWADYSTQTGKVTLRRYFESPFAPELKGARGGAVDGNLAIVHEVDESSGKRVYTHRFVLYDEKDEIADVSPSFAFQHSGIEFCAGLARYEGKVWLTYGVHDAEAFACCVDEKELLAWAFGEKRSVFPRPVAPQVEVLSVPGPSVRCRCCLLRCVRGRSARGAPHRVGGEPTCAWRGVR